MAPPLLTLSGITLGFGGEPVLDGAELAVGQGERLCLVGRNGSGKSTFLKIAAGIIEPDGGERFVKPDTTVRYLAQEPDLAGFATVRAFVDAGLGPGDDPHRARRLLEQLGLTGDEAPARLSGGEARRAALAQALAPAPDILLLDEPTNHLDIAAIEWLERELRGMDAAVVLISHDRRLLETIAGAVVWLDRGRARRLDAGFARFEAWRDGILEQEDTERHKLDRQIHREMQWLHKGVTARRKRNMGRMRALQDLRRQRREQRQAPGQVRLAASEAETSGKRVIDAENVSKSYGGRPVVKEVSTRILRGDRVGIVGPNGAGKTTLLNLLTGAMTPDAGKVTLGTTLEVATLDQRRESLEPGVRLQDALTGGRGDQVTVAGQTRHVVGYMKDFLFPASYARMPVSALSGGERGRLMLARAFTRPSNLLVLDEPTNDLDLETLDLLQEMLADYAGTVLLVSHDRDFLDRVVTSVIAAEGDGVWREYAGGYTDMLAQRRGTPAGDAGGSKDGATKPKRQGGAAKPPAGRQAKLSYKDKHALDALPRRMTELEAEIARLETILADPGLYGRDPGGFQKTTAELHAARAALAEAEDEWLRLEMKREELEGAG